MRILSKSNKVTLTHGFYIVPIVERITVDVVYLLICSTLFQLSSKFNVHITELLLTQQVYWTKKVLQKVPD